MQDIEPKTEITRIRISTESIDHGLMETLEELGYPRKMINENKFLVIQNTNVIIKIRYFYKKNTHLQITVQSERKFQLIRKKDL